LPLRRRPCPSFGGDTEECKRGNERRALGAFAPRPLRKTSNGKQATAAAARTPARERGLAQSPLRWPRSRLRRSPEILVSPGRAS
jgi:hypothetical protein